MNRFSLQRLAVARRGPWHVVGAIIAHFLPAAALAASANSYGPLERVAPGVYVQRGADQAPTTANRGAIGNLGVLIGASGVIVVNTGSSTEHGAQLLAAVARLTDRPVVLAIDTQASPDQVLGNSAFAQRGIPVLALRDTDAFMSEHCDGCAADVKAKADNDAIEATHMSRPTRLIDGSQTIRAGDRTIQVLHYGWTEQPGAAAVLDLESNVLFTGDLASFGVVPQTQLSRLPGWIEALKQMEALGAAVVVPGHGAPGLATRLGEMRDYLQQLLDGIGTAYRRGDGLLETVDHLEIARFRRWALYDVYHRRNVHFAYLQIEEEELKR